MSAAPSVGTPLGTTIAPDVRIVDQHVARNPIARAVALQRLRSATRSFITRLYMLEQGEDVAADAYVAARTLYLAHVLASNAGRADTPDARVMHGALNAARALAQRGWRWHPADAGALDAGLKRAEDEVARASAKALQAAWIEVAAAEMAAEARAGTC